MLSTEEIALAANADVLLTKNRIIQEVYQMFGRLADTFRLDTMHLPGSLTIQHPKIAKGENYLGLPWALPDYPRNFELSNIFAVRTMFWWGNFFSLQLLLKGASLPMLDTSNMQRTLPAQWFFCTGSTPWQHHFSADYMQPLSAMTPERIYRQKQENEFLKIGAKLPVTEWENAELFLKNKFLEILQCISPVMEEIEKNSRRAT